MDTRDKKKDQFTFILVRFHYHGYHYKVMSSVLFLGCMDYRVHTDYISVFLMDAFCIFWSKYSFRFSVKQRKCIFEAAFRPSCREINLTENMTKQFNEYIKCGTNTILKNILLPLLSLFFFPG